MASWRKTDWWKRALDNLVDQEPERVRRLFNDPEQGPERLGQYLDNRCRKAEAMVGAAQRAGLGDLECQEVEQAALFAPEMSELGETRRLSRGERAQVTAWMRQQRQSSAESDEEDPEELATTDSDETTD